MATASIEIIADSSQVRTATRDLQALAQQGAPTKAAAAGATKSIGAVGKSAGQAGIQIQQFIGQIQGGQSALVALAQQSADLGFVLGAPLLGAIVSITAAAVGMGIAAANGSKDITTLDEAVKRLGDAVIVTDKGVALLSQEIEKLAKVSKEAAKAQLAQEIIDAKNVITTSIRDINDSFSSVSNAISSAEGAFAIYRQAVDDGTASQEGLSISSIDLLSPISKLQQLIAQLNGEFNISSAQSFKLAEALFEVRKTGSAESIQNLQNTLAQLNSETGYSNEQLTKFSSKMGESFSATRNASEIIQAAEGFLADFDSALAKSTEGAVDLTDKTERLTQQLTIQNMELRGARLEAALYAAALSTGKESADELDPVIKQLVIDNFNLAESKRQVTSQAKEETQAQRELIRELKAENDERLKARSTAERFNSVRLGINAQGDPVEQARQQLQARLDVIKEYSKLETADKELALQAQLDAEYKYTQQVAEIRAKENESLQAIDWESFGNRAAGSLALVATGATSGREAISGLAMSIATEAIGALIRLGIQSIATTSATTAAGTAQAAALTTAYAPAAAAASIATAGGAAISGTTIALASIGTIIAALAVGRRATGGSVYNGSSYLVGERGPELFTPNSSGGGNITPYSQLMNEQRGNNGNSSAPIYLNITMDQNAKTDSVTQSNLSDRRIIDVVVANGRNRGAVHKMITDTTTATGRV